MASRTYNPFQNLGIQYVNGLDYIINNLPTPLEDTTFEILNQTLIEYLQSILSDSEEPDPVPPIIDNVVYSVLPNITNSYQNSNLFNESFYNPAQLRIVSSVFNTIKNNSIESIGSLLIDVNNEIAQSGLSAIDQAPLFVAIEIGRKSSEYWNTIVTTPPPATNWTTFLNSNPAINTANIPYWVTASIEASLSGYAQIQQLDMSAATALNSVGRAVGGTSAMLAAIGLSAGKVIFKWGKKRPSSCGC